MLKPIPGYNGYFADERGNIYSKRPHGGKNGNGTKPPEEPRKLSPGKSGRYDKVRLQQHGRPKSITVGRAVLLAFMGKPPKDFEVCHGILGAKNDTLKNLSWGSRHKNHYDDQLRDGTLHYGENHCRAKLNELQVRIIRKAYVKHKSRFDMIFGLSSCELAKIFNVSEGLILHIIKRRIWNHINQE